MRTTILSHLVALGIILLIAGLGTALMAPLKYVTEGGPAIYLLITVLVGIITLLGHLIFIAYASNSKDIGLHWLSMATLFPHAFLIVITWVFSASLGISRLIS